MTYHRPDFATAISKALEAFVHATPTHTQKWQGINIADKPEMRTYELLDYSFKVPVTTESLDVLREDIRPNLPWADDHFLERVGGEPLNPGVQWANWPYAKSADRFRTEGQGQFSHTYMERIWPRFAGQTTGGELPLSGFEGGANHGYRYRYGDLNDLVNLLADEPDTRQAYLPLWFPEDTGVVHGGRVPCTLGYFFIMRHGFLHATYYIRSCDVVRHFRDDIYLSVRLLLWILNQCRAKNPEVWNKVIPGNHLMHITSFHMFENDYRQRFSPKR